MGIDGLLNLLRPVTEKQHISAFKGKTVAVDAMPWIYKGCYSCAMELNQNVESIDFLYYILQMLDMLSYYSIKPIFVFDGRALHAKNDTLEKRKKNKEENKQKGLEFLKNNQLEQAKKYLSRCIIIDERIITMTINCLVTKNIEFYVAPYQADCQIAKLKRLGLVDAVISEDSDLIIFGLNVILKLNQNGECDYVDLTKWRPKDVNDVFLKYFLAFDELSRIDAGILAGSDYNQSVKGIGIKRAIKLLTTQVTMKNVINKLKHKKTYMARIPQDYEQTVERSKLIFNLSTVYNPISKQLEYLRPELVSELKPEQMSEDRLVQIVGKHYEYTEEVVQGRVSSKTLEKRDIRVLNFPQIFRVNKENMLAHEALIKRKKIQDEELRQMSNPPESIDNMNPNASDQMIFQQLNEFKKRAGVQQTEEEVQRRKEERKNRINQLHQLMSSLVDVFGESQDEQSLPNSDEESEHGQYDKKPQFVNPFLKKTHDKKEVDALSTVSKPVQDKFVPSKPVEEKYISEEESVSDDFTFLNPFLVKDKKPTQNAQTAEKTQIFKTPPSKMKQQTLFAFKNQ